MTRYAILHLYFRRGRLSHVKGCLSSPTYLKELFRVHRESTRSRKNKIIPEVLGRQKTLKVDINSTFLYNGVQSFSLRMEYKMNRIRNFPISFFSVILGMAGCTIAYQKAEQVLGVPIHISQYVLWLTCLLFGTISIIYLTKMLKYKDEVRLEFNHPIRLSFFPTVSISLLLLSVAFLSVNMSISRFLCVAGTILHFVLTIKIISIWIQKTNFNIKHMNPSWFIPAVGNILVPVSGVSHFSMEISWFFFSIGLVFWIILLVIFFNRIIFHDPMPDKLVPTLFILIAPPAVGFISLVKLTGEINEFSRVLYYIGLFLACLLFSQFRMFAKIKYYLSWWAYSFPVAAITIASILMFHESHVEAFRYISYVFFLLLNLIIVLLLFKTIAAISQKDICVEEE
jgi:tellurite resistance protein